MINSDAFNDHFTWRYTCVSVRMIVRVLFFALACSVLGFKYFVFSLYPIFTLQPKFDCSAIARIRAHHELP